MQFITKAIAVLQSELRDNPFDLDKMAELYTAYALSGNAMVLLEIAEARYKILARQYPSLTEYISIEQYAEKKYFESLNRIKLENVFMTSADNIKIQFPDQKRNPQNSFLEIYKLHDEYWREAVSIVLHERALNPEELKKLKQYVFSSIKTLGCIYQQTKILNSLTVENYNEKYFELVESMNYLLIAAQTKRKLIFLKEIIYFNGYPDVDIVGLIESDEQFKRLLR